MFRSHFFKSVFDISRWKVQKCQVYNETSKPSFLHQNEIAMMRGKYSFATNGRTDVRTDIRVKVVAWETC